jgi:flagellin-like hook-associated protein FlgL
MRANLISLQLTDKMIMATQNRLSTGKKVNSAMDDPVNFFAAESHLTHAADLAARKDGMSEAIQIVTSADKGITAINTLVEQAKGIATSALSTNDINSRVAYASQYNTVMNQIVTLAGDAGYNGTNLLNNGSIDVKFNEAGTSMLTVTGFAATTLQSIGLTMVTSDAFSSEIGINSAIAQIGSASEILRTKAKTLAANMNVITTRQDFTKDMIDVLKTGADNLTLADMNEESANMLMLQTRQSLGTTSLSIASQAAQSVLRLFS